MSFMSKIINKLFGYGANKKLGKPLGKIVSAVTPDKMKEKMIADSLIKTAKKPLKKIKKLWKNK